MPLHLLARDGKLLAGAEVMGKDMEAAITAEDEITGLDAERVRAPQRSERRAERVHKISDLAEDRLHLRAARRGPEPVAERECQPADLVPFAMTTHVKCQPER